MSKITANMLQTYGVNYLNRYAPSIQQYRQVLQRKVKRILQEHGGDKEEAFMLIEQEIQKRIAQKVLDDAEYARVWVQHLHEKGKSKFAIIQKLKQKGIAENIIQASTAEISLPKIEIKAAIAYAKKRRFGPFNTIPERSKKKRQKEIASMLRAGHTYAHVKKIIDAKAQEDLWDLGEFE